MASDNPLTASSQSEELEEFEYSHMQAVFERLRELPTEIESPDDVRQYLPLPLVSKYDEMLRIGSALGKIGRDDDTFIFLQWIGINPKRDLRRLYEDAEFKFLGGFEAFLTRLDRMKFDHKSSVVETVLLDEWPSQDDLKSFIDLGEEILEGVGADRIAGSYFDIRTHYSGPLKIILDEDRNTFREFIIGAVENSKAPEQNGCLRRVFDFQLAAYGSENFERIDKHIKSLVRMATERKLKVEQTDDVIYYFTDFLKDAVAGHILQTEKCEGYSFEEARQTDLFPNKEGLDYDAIAQNFVDFVFCDQGDPVHLADEFRVYSGSGLRPALVKKLVFGNSDDEPKIHLYPNIGIVLSWVDTEEVKLWEMEDIDSETRKGVQMMIEAECADESLQYLGRAKPTDENDEVKFFFEIFDSIVALDESAAKAAHEKWTRSVSNSVFKPKLPVVSSFGQAIDNAVEVFGRLEEMNRDEAYKRLFNFGAKIEALKSSIQFAQFRHSLGTYVHRAMRVDSSPLLEFENESTKFVLAGSALLIALGANNRPEISKPLLALPSHDNKSGSANGEVAELLDLSKRFDWLALQEKIDLALPRLAEFVQRERLKTPGLMPVGGKIHVQRPVDPNLLDFLNATFSLGSTPFHLIHANQSLVLPPTVTAAELEMLILILEKFGMIDLHEPELQVAMAGRWSRETAAMVGSSMLLGTKRGVRYKKGAFQTTHDKQTGARVMCYDEGVKLAGMPFDIPGAKGRTDMLGRRIASDIGMYQRLGTLATHLEFGGPFKGLANIYRDAFQNVLNAHGLAEVIQETPWVYEQGSLDTLEAHEAMVSKVTEAWFRARNLGPQCGYGVIGEVRGLIGHFDEKIRGQAPKISREMPDELEKLKTY